ncbi:MAG: phosphoribosylanthranilate isomerase [Clostridiales bacterium]|nr:phosphoribosylanthranilate isomerase [Clostridiales bacterium]
MLSGRRKTMKIKICGLCRREDVAYINEARPDFAGFVIHVPESRRSIDVAQLKALSAALAPGIVPVGVFVDAPPKLVCGLLLDGVIGAAQLHGREDEAYIKYVLSCVADKMAGQDSGKRWKMAPVIKAVRVRGREDVIGANHCPAPMVLLDSGAGSGKTFAWPLLKDIRRPYMLAGGLDEENIGEAARLLSPWAVDLSSSVETGGVKDRDKILRIVSVVRDLRKGG